MIELLGARHNLVNFGRLKVWAERGMIRIEDAADNSYETISVRTAKFRVKAINDMIGKSTDQLEYADILREYQTFVERMISVIAQAEVQGMPDDKTATNSLKNARKRSFVMPAELPAAYQLPL